MTFIANRDLGDETETKELDEAFKALVDFEPKPDDFVGLEFPVEPQGELDRPNSHGFGCPHDGDDLIEYCDICGDPDDPCCACSGSGRQSGDGHREWLRVQRWKHADMGLEYYETMFKALGAPDCERHGEYCSVAYGEWLRGLITEIDTLKAERAHVHRADFGAGLAAGTVIVIAALFLLRLFI